MIKAATRDEKLRAIFDSLRIFAVTLGAGVWLLAAAGCSKKQDASVLTNYEALREAAVALVEKHQIVPDQTGQATLPEKVREASVDGRIYVSEGEGNPVVAFNITPGGSPRMDYLVHSVKPISNDVGLLPVGHLNLILKSKVNDHWYLMRQQPP